MPGLYPITNWVKGDEKAWWLLENNYQSPDYKGFHRYQIVFVVRADKLHEHHIDMGLTSKYKGVKCISIPALFEHTVDELRDIAQEIRYEKDRVDILDIAHLDKVNLA